MSWSLTLKNKIARTRTRIFTHVRTWILAYVLGVCLIIVAACFIGLLFAIDWADRHAPTVQALATIILVAVTASYACAAWYQLQQLKGRDRAARQRAVRGIFDELDRNSSLPWDGEKTGRFGVRFFGEHYHLLAQTAFSQVTVDAIYRAYDAMDLFNLRLEAMMFPAHRLEQVHARGPAQIAHTNAHDAIELALTKLKKEHGPWPIKSQPVPAQPTPEPPRPNQ